MSGHTPGPWSAQRAQIEEEGIWIIGLRLNSDNTPLDTPTNGAVAFVSMQPTEIDAEDFTRCAANARLIAAAPEMLEALQKLYEDVDCVHATGYWSESFADTKVKMSAVIAKAIGS